MDRLTFKAHIIETGSDSYRLRLSRDVKGAARETDHVVWVGPDLIITMGPNQAIIPTVLGLVRTGSGWGLKRA